MKYTKSHEWVSLEGNEGKVGISEHAQNELGDIVFVELPDVGTEVEAGKEIAVLESTKAAADVYSPVSGKITEVNEELNDSPELINSSPLDQGWIFKIELRNTAELDQLMDQPAYEGMFK